MRTKGVMGLLPISLINIQRLILLMASLLLVSSLVITVLLRYVFNSDLFGLEEFIIIPGFWLYFLGAAYGTRDDSHIKADLVTEFVTNKSKVKIIQVITQFITFITCVIMTVWGFDFLLWSYNSGAKSPALNIPSYFSQMSVFIGFLLMSIYFLTNLIRDIISLIKGNMNNKSGDLIE